VCVWLKFVQEHRTFNYGKPNKHGSAANAKVIANGVTKPR